MLLALTVLISSSPAVFPGNRVLTELVSKMKDMQMDKSELGCLRAIVLFNPGEAWSTAQHRHAGPRAQPGQGRRARRLSRVGTGPAPHGLHSQLCLGES